MSESDPRLTNAAVDRAMTTFEARADEWAVEVDLPGMIKNLVHVNRLNPNAPDDVREKFIARQAEQIDAIIKQAFIEGQMREHDATADCILPCDVSLPPNTVIRKGCRVGTLMDGIAGRALAHGQEVDKR